MSQPAAFHVHVQTNESDAEVFRFREEHLAAALGRNPDLEGKVRMTLAVSGNKLSEWTPDHHDELRHNLATADIVVGYYFPFRTLADRQTAPQLKVIHIIGSGVEFMLPFDWKPDDLAVTNNRGVHAPKSGEFAGLCLQMLNFAMPQLVTFQRRAEYRQIFTPVIVGKTVLIVGVGEMGGAAARAAKALGLHVIGTNRSKRAHPAVDEMHGPEALHDLIPRADFILLTLPLTSQTRGLFGQTEFDLMKPTAGFINMARAETVDYKVLIRKLEAGEIAGAILDVFNPEPLPSDSPLWTTPNLIMTPHVGSDDRDSYVHLTLDLALDNARRLMEGRSLRNVVDPGREY